ncbi:MAG: Gfo/Idh/MocA family oxidoreductase [Phycisphaerae bacterium]|nr:Gfo/Idh/MocA family oxidoreductase [Phycisphaerae bacterium]
MMASREVRVVVVGCGGMGGVHAKAWQKIEGVKIVGCCDARSDIVDAFAEKFGVANKFKDLKKAAACDADVLDVCTPNSAHTPAVLAGLANKKHVLCEKPLAITPAEVVRMMDASRKARRLLMCAQHMRFDGVSQGLKKWIDGGHMGEVYYARAWHNRRRLLPAWGAFISKKASGGGPCVDVGVHALDLTMWLMGNFEPVSVSGVAPCKIAKKPGIYNTWGAYKPKDMEVEDFAAGFIRFKNGAALSLEASWMMNIHARSEAVTWVYGTNAGVKWPTLEIVEEKNGIITEGKIDNPPEAEGHEVEIVAFHDAVVNRKPAPVPPEQTLAVIKVLDGLYRSHKTGREVSLR